MTIKRLLPVPLAFVLLLWAAPASKTDPFRVSIADFGAVANPAYDNTPEIQRAVDTMADRLRAVRAENPAADPTGTITIPQAANSYGLAGTVWVDEPGIVIKGEGNGSCLVAPNTSCRPMFLLGLRRTVPPGPGIAKTLVADSNYRPDLFGLLDVTAVTAKNQRWGARFRGDSFIQCQATPLDAGGTGVDGTADNWLGVKTLTIEAAVSGPDGGVMPGGVPIACLGNPASNATNALGAYCLFTDAPNSYVCMFATQARPFGPETVRRFGFRTGTATGIQRVAAQIDLVKMQVSAFGPTDNTGAIRQLATSNILGDGWGPGISLVENDYFPLLIGDAAGARPSLGNANGHDWISAGLCLSRTIRYQLNGVGTPQVRADSPATAVNDRYRYFTPRAVGTPPPPDLDPGTIGYLSFEDDPATLGRQMTVRHGPAADGWGVSSGFLIHSLQTLPGGIIGNEIRDLKLVGGGHYGQNIAVGQVLKTTFENVRSENAYHGIGSLSNGANYIVRVKNCYLGGYDAGYFANSQIVRLDDVTFPIAGRGTMRFVGCDWTARDVFVEQWSANSEAALFSHSGDYGGTGYGTDWAIDYEGSTYRRSVIVAEPSPYLLGSVRLENVWAGTTGDVPFLELTAPAAPWFRPAKVMLKNIQANGSDTPLVSQAPGYWSIEGTFAPRPITPVEPLPFTPGDLARPALPQPQ